MASSPPPPSSSSLPNPKKRQSMSSNTSFQSAAKKPKLHPLRKTSFAASANDTSTIGGASESGSMVNSTVSGTSSKVPGGRKRRPRKSTQLTIDDQLDVPNQNDDGQSQTGRSQARSAVSAKPGEAVDEEEEEEEGDHMMGLDEKQRITEWYNESKQKQLQLRDLMDEHSQLRYDRWNAAKLSDNAVRKMANAVTSQSIGKVPLQAVTFYTKYYVGEILERAREVQMEYVKAYDKTREMEKKWREDELARLEGKLRAGGMEQQDMIMAHRDVTRLRKEVVEYMPNPHRGGLLPDHLREAVRRYRADGDGGGVGQAGMSHGLLGQPGSSSHRVGDGAAPRRLFR